MLGNSFVWDDEEMVVNNSAIFKLSNIPQLFSSATFNTGGSGLGGWFYRPLVMLTFLLIHTVFGLWTPAYHLVQLAFHLGVGVLVFLLFKDMLAIGGNRFSRIVAYGLSLIFLVHPANTESVGYISALGEPLFALFVLGALYLVIKAKFTRKRLLATGVLFALGLLTKEGAVILLPIAILWSFFFQKRRELFRVTAALLSGLGIYLFIRLSFFGIQTQRPDFISPISDASFYHRLLTGVGNFFVFLKTFVFPKTLAIANHEVITNPTDCRFIIGTILVLLFLSSSVLWFLKKKKLELFFLMWFLISYLPVSNIIFPLDMSFADRWLYFPMIGLLGLIGVLLLRVKYKLFLSVLVLLFFSVALFSTRTIVRNTNWRNGLTLYSHDVRINDNFDLNNNYGVELFRNGDIENAKMHFEKSISQRPEWNVPHNNLGATLEREGDLEGAKKEYKRSVELGDYYLSFQNLAAILVSTHDPNALDFIKTAFGKFPNSPSINRSAALAYYNAGDQTQALYFARRLLSLEPTEQNQILYNIIFNKQKLDF
ncbi:MAG: hypothetical protein AAB599_01805 [Patescibacteria group bacterium]